MKRLILHTAIALSLVVAPAAALERIRHPLTKSQCEKLYDLWWKAEDVIASLQGCRNNRCQQEIDDLLHTQAEIATVWKDGDCDRHWQKGS